MMTIILQMKFYISPLALKREHQALKFEKLDVFSGGLQASSRE
jgi:hypothetical protein